MNTAESVITDQYALYLGDCIEGMRGLPNGCVHLSIYSPPFCGLYQYSSDERDLSNCDSYENFFEHYAFVVRELHRLTMPGRLSAVHTAEIPNGNTGGASDFQTDFPGDVIRLHEKLGWKYIGRHIIWKEPLWVRNRTMTKALAHATIVEDSAYAGIASPDYLLLFRRSGTNPIPIAHPSGFDHYAGETPIPTGLLRFRNWKGKQTENRYSHWIWRQYASSVWDDIRMGEVLPYQECREPDDEKHVHPLQLDVIERVVQLRSNPGETVLTPFMGVGSEVYGAVMGGRRGIGFELKASYFRQAVKNLELGLARGNAGHQNDIYDLLDEEGLPLNGYHEEVAIS